MRAGELDLYIERGSDWERTLTVYKQSGNPIDLSVAEIEMQIRDSAQGTILCTPEIKIAEPKAGKFKIHIDRNQTAKLPAHGRHYGQTTRCVYDVFIQRLSRRERLLNGFVNISPEVTRK